MKFKEYLEEINRLAKTNPELLDKEVVHSSDLEGNNYHFVVYPPSKGHFNGATFESHDMTENDVNSVLLN